MDEVKKYKVTVAFQGKSEFVEVELDTKGWVALSESLALVEFLTGADVMILRVV